MLTTSFQGFGTFQEAIQRLEISDLLFTRQPRIKPSSRYLMKQQIKKEALTSMPMSVSMLLTVKRALKKNESLGIILFMKQISLITSTASPLLALQLKSMTTLPRTMLAALSTGGNKNRYRRKTTLPCVCNRVAN
jgi:hypothetical protein